MSKPTDIEVLSGILADFPTDAATIESLWHRLNGFLRAHGRGPGDRTIDEEMLERAHLLDKCLCDLRWVVDCIENDRSPAHFMTSHPSGYHDDIPF